MNTPRIKNLPTPASLARWEVLTETLALASHLARSILVITGWTIYAVLYGALWLIDQAYEGTLNEELALVGIRLIESLPDRIIENELVTGWYVRLEDYLIARSEEDTTPEEEDEEQDDTAWFNFWEEDEDEIATLLRLDDEEFADKDDFPTSTF